MRSHLYIIYLLLAVTTYAAEYSLTKGTTLKDAQITDRGPGWVAIKHSAGFGRYNISEFTADTQNILLLDESNASANSFSGKYTENTPFHGTIELARDALPDYVNKPPLAPRGQFETQEEYALRIQSRDTASTPRYFTVNEEYSYKYDIDKQVITCFAGKGMDPADKETMFRYASAGDYVPRSGVPIVIDSSYDDQGDYIGSNAYGAEIQIHKSHLFYYILNIANIAILPNDIYDNSRKRFIITLSIDRDAARNLSTNLQVVVGVTLPGNKYSVMKCVYSHKPTFDDPKDMSAFNYLVEAKICSVYFIDKRSNNVVRAWESNSY